MEQKRRHLERKNGQKRLCRRDRYGHRLRPQNLQKSRQYDEDRPSGIKPSPPRAATARWAIAHPTLGTVNLGYGVEYDRDKIRQALESDHPENVVRHKDKDGHGSHVAGIAAGDGSQSDACCGTIPRAWRRKPT